MQSYLIPFQKLKGELLHDWIINHSLTSEQPLMRNYMHTKGSKPAGTAVLRQNFVWSVPTVILLLYFSIRPNMTDLRRWVLVRLPSFRL